ncbi:hypothetical protein DITRI_Ditri05aG0006700 [Diplodiscus trichospermus]
MGKQLLLHRRRSLKKENLLWRNAIVAQIVGKIPNFNAFQKMVNVLWGESGNVDIRLAEKCSHCGIFGHGDKTCAGKSAVIQTWVPKQKTNNEEKGSKNVAEQQQPLIKSLTVSDQLLNTTLEIEGETSSRKDLKHNVVNSTGSPPILAGDFNVISHPSESSGFDGSQGGTTDTKDFKDCIHHLTVLDHVYTGLAFTWSNKHKENLIAKKLDRVLINRVWLNYFSCSSVEFLPPGVLDHCPAYIQLF